VRSVSAAPQVAITDISVFNRSLKNGQPGARRRARRHRDGADR
jgi:hypothetical protein